MLRASKNSWRGTTCIIESVQIVVVTTWFPTNRHLGAGSFIKRDVEALSREHDVSVIHLVPPELDDGVRHAPQGGYDVRAIPIDVRTPAGLIAASRHMRTLVTGADLVHTMAAPALLAFLLRGPQMPWVHTEHWSGVTNLTRTPKARMALPLSRRAFNRPDHVVAVSEYLATGVRALRRRPVSVIGNIVDAPRASTHGPMLFRDQPGLKVLGVGTANEHKGWRIAVEAVERLNTSGVDAQLLWLGSGPDSGQLRDEARRGRVIAPGQVSAEVVRASMSNADVLVLPTRSETFSLATVEALSEGLPVVATGVGGHGELLSSDSGLLVERSPDAVAGALIAASRLDRSAVRRRGDVLTAQYSQQEFLRRYGEIYREVTER